jgi:hypothetical protein
MSSGRAGTGSSSNRTTGREVVGVPAAKVKPGPSSRPTRQSLRGPAASMVWSRWLMLRP